MLAQRKRPKGRCPAVDHNIKCIRHYDQCPIRGRVCSKEIDRTSYCCPGPCGNECKYLVRNNQGQSFIL